MLLDLLVFKLFPPSLGALHLVPFQPQLSQGLLPRTAGCWEAEALGDPSLAAGSESRDWLMISLWGKDKANSSSKRDVPFTQFLCLDQVAGSEARAGGRGVCVDGPGEGQVVSSRL